MKTLAYKTYSVLHRLVARPQHRGEYSGGRWQDKVRLAALRMSAGISGQALEVGCGEGLFLQEAVKVLPKVRWWGGDLSDSRLKSAARRVGQSVQLVHLDAGALPFEEGFFDEVVCLNVFFNMASLDVVDKALGEMCRVCRPGGRIIFDYRSAHNPFLALKYKYAQLYDATTHGLPLKVYRHSDVDALICRYDLEKSGREQVYFPFNVPAIIIIKARKR